MLIPLRSTRSRSTLIAAVGLVAPILIGGIGPAGAAPVAAQTRAKVITLTAAPNGVAVNPKTDMIYAEAYAGDVFAINGKTDKVIATVTVPSPAPLGIVVDAKRNLIYTVNYLGAKATVSVISGKTNKVVRKIKAGSPSEGGLAFNPKTDRLYLSKNRTGVLTVINAKAGTIIKNINVGGRPGAVAVDPATNTIYLAHNAVAEEPGPDVIINGKTNKIVQKLKTGAEPFSVGIDPGSNRAYVADLDGSVVYVVSLRGHGRKAKITRKIQLGLETGPRGIAVDAANHRVMVNDSYEDSDAPKNKIAIINGKTDKIIRAVRVGSDSDGVAVDSATHVAYASVYGASEIAIIPGS